MLFRKNDLDIPHHSMVRFLGRGALGEVWLMRGPGGVHKATKFIRLELHHGVKELLAIQRIKQIHHAHLVQITDVWLLDEHGTVIPDDDIDRLTASLRSSDRKSALTATMVPESEPPHTLVVAMTLGDKSLFDRFKECQEQGQSAIPYDELIRYMQEAAKGIDFLNQPHPVLGGKSIQHCDIKPQNMLLVGGSVQICDFGLTRLVGERKTSNQMEGTVAYIAPEAARGEQPTPTTDQYSLAISYYELRTGHLPYDENSSVYEIVATHASGKLDFTQVSEAERKVLRQATALDPTKRFPSNSAFVDALVAANSVLEKPPNLWLKAAIFVMPTVMIAIAVLALVLGNSTKGPPKNRPIELPPPFAAVPGTPVIEIGNRLFPSRIQRVFADGDSVVFVLVHEPSEEQLFYMMENKVWNTLYQRFVNEKPDENDSQWQLGGKTADSGTIGLGDGRLPALRITVDRAHAFSQWLVGSKGHLPSVRQWDTAAGLYRPNHGAGPFLEPFTADQIAVNREPLGPMPVGTAANDKSPFGVRDMAGNGTEFTRTLFGRREEVPLPDPTDVDAVILRGRSYASSEGPLRYEDLQNSKEDLPWVYTAPSPYIGFRVVMEKLTIPTAVATDRNHPSSDSG